MKHYRFLTAAITLTALMAACSDKEHEPNNTDGRTALSIHAGIAQSAESRQSATRAVDSDWQPNDAIGILMLDAGTTTVTEGKTNYRYLTATGNGTFAPDGKEHTAYFPTGGASVDLLAYYPYTAAVTAENLRIPIDVSRQDNLPAIDLMTPDKAVECSAEQPDVTLAFTHRLCKLILQVVTDETTGGIDLNGAKATLSGTPVTGEWDLPTGKLTPKEEASPLTLPMTADGTRATAIVMPTAAGAGKSITLTTADGKSYTAEIADNLALAAGTVNTYTMTLHRNQASITASIRPWTGGTDADLQTLHIDLPADGTADGLTTFQMWRNQTQATDSRTYTFDATAGKWSATPAPFYVEEIAPTDAFYALHTPEDADKNPITGLKDLIAAGPVMMKDYSVEFSFAHLMAQLNITLNRSSDFPQEASLEGATITLPPMTTTYTLDGITLTPVDTQQGTYPALPVKSGRTETLLVVPQTLPEGAVITVRLAGGNTYKATLPATGMQLAAGKKSTLVLTLQATQASIGIAVNPWTDGDETAQTLTIDGIGSSTGTSSYTAADDDKLTLRGTNENSADETLQANYTYKVSADWQSDAPLYWDSFTRLASENADATGKNAVAASETAVNTFRFDALITPADAPADNRAAAGAVKDYLQATLSGIRFGAPLSFELRHLMAQTSVTLKPGTGYTAADLAENATVLLHGLHTLTDAGVSIDGTLTLSPAPADTPLKMIRATQTDTEGNRTHTALIAPQEIAAGETVAAINVSCTEAGQTTTHTYFYRAPEGGFAYHAGQNRKLVLTVSKSGVSATFTLTDWDDSQKPTEGDVTID